MSTRFAVGRARGPARASRSPASRPSTGARSRGRPRQLPVPRRPPLPAPPGPTRRPTVRNDLDMPELQRAVRRQRSTPTGPRERPASVANSTTTATPRPPWLAADPVLRPRRAGGLDRQTGAWILSDEAGSGLVAAFLTPAPAAARRLRPHAWTHGGHRPGGHRRIRARAAARSSPEEAVRPQGTIDGKGQQALLATCNDGAPGGLRQDPGGAADRRPGPETADMGVATCG